jgi:hypothetical protein
VRLALILFLAPTGATECSTYRYRWSGLCIDGTSNGASNCQCTEYSGSGVTEQHCRQNCDMTAGCTGYAFHGGGHCKVYTSTFTQWTHTEHYLLYTCYGRDGCPPSSPPPGPESPDPSPPPTLSPAPFWQASPPSSSTVEATAEWQAHCCSAADEDLSQRRLKEAVANPYTDFVTAMRRLPKLQQHLTMQAPANGDWSDPHAEDSRDQDPDQESRWHNH